MERQPKTMSNLPLTDEELKRLIQGLQDQIASLEEDNKNKQLEIEKLKKGNDWFTERDRLLQAQIVELNQCFNDLHEKVVNQQIVTGSLVEVTDWTQNEDEKLEQLWYNPSKKFWGDIAKEMQGRTSQQCRLRWKQLQLVTGPYVPAVPLIGTNN